MGKILRLFRKESVKVQNEKKKSSICGKSLFIIINRSNYKQQKVSLLSIFVTMKFFFQHVSDSLKSLLKGTFIVDNNSEWSLQTNHFSKECRIYEFLLWPLSDVYSEPGQTSKMQSWKIFSNNAAFYYSSDSPNVLSRITWDKYLQNNKYLRDLENIRKISKLDGDRA